MILQIINRVFFISILIAALCMFCIIGFEGIAYAQAQGLPGTAGEIQGLSSEQKQLVESELVKSGGVLTPETLKLLEESPAFKGLGRKDTLKGEGPSGGKEPVKDHEATEGSVSEGAKAVGSLFDRYRTVGPYQGISTDLRPFGYEIFSGALKKPLMPRNDIPVAPDYIIGPGDEIKMLLWGRVNAEYDLVVNKDGEVIIPNIGPLRVSGMNFGEVKNYLADQANRIVGANISITMGALKSIQVFVLGEARKPGSYSLDSYSTITSAVFASGGPTDIGSLRNIQLKRNDRTIEVMDFYDFLLKGDKTHDKILQSGDVVFIPTVGPLVGIAGNVKRPAVYELKKRQDLMNLFDMAGGVTPSAYTQQIQVERIQKNEKQIVVDIDDKNLTKAKDFMLHDGDLVKIFSIVGKDANAVFLNGNVKHPGKYEYKTGMRVKDLIKDSTDLLKETYFKYALIKRLKPPGLGTELIPFNLARLLFEGDDASNIRLEPQDSVYVFSKWVFKDKPSITVQGEVRNEGSFSLLNNYKVRDAILEAGGLTKDAGLKKGEIFRIAEDGSVIQIYFNVGLAMAEDLNENILLRDRDRVVIHSLWEERYKFTVSIDGDVKNPGEYPLAEDMRITDLIFSAGNLLESTYMEEAEVSSYIVDQGKKVRLDYRTVNLAQAMKDDPAHNLVLRPYDRVFVKRIPEWRGKRFMTVSGEVRFPGRYIIKKGERLSSVIERAGGYTDKAYLRGSVFRREEVREIQQKGIDEMIARLEKALLVEGSLQVSTALSGEEVEAKKVELEQQQKFIMSLGKLKATGRMSIRLSHLRLLKNSEYDIELEEGDSLSIPRKNSVVNVVGSVMSSASFVYMEKADYKDYIKMAGGFTKYADEDSVYVLKVDGTAMKLSRGLLKWNISRERWELAPFNEDIKEIEPGDSIVVPEDLDRIAWLREIKDITQVLYQIAIAAGVAIVAF